MDDDHHARFLIGALLDYAGYTVVPACDGLAALNELSKRYFDVVVTDYRMPVLNDIELLRQVQVRYPRLPVILVSATLPEDISRLDCRPFACIRKPYNNPQLLEAVRSAAQGLITSRSGETWAGEKRVRRKHRESERLASWDFSDPPPLPALTLFPPLC